jgi:hypothetical protein
VTAAEVFCDSRGWAGAKRYVFANPVLDDSGNGNDWTESDGTVIFEGQPELPDDEFDAVTIAALPFTALPNPDRAFDEFWYRFTPPSSDNAFSIRAVLSAGSGYAPRLNVWYGEAGDLLPYMEGFISGVNGAPILVPTFGTAPTLFLQIDSTGGTPSGAQVTFTAVDGADLRAVLEMRRHAPDGREYGLKAYVFGNETGERVTSIRTAWNLAVLRAHGHAPVYEKHGSRLAPESLEALRLIDLNFHDLRREFACRLLESSADLHDVRDFPRTRQHHHDVSVSAEPAGSVGSGSGSAGVQHQIRRYRTRFAHGDTSDRDAGESPSR